MIGMAFELHGGPGPKPPRADQAERIAELLNKYAFRWSSEVDLQDCIESVLRAASVEYSREHRLSDEDRPDFLCGGCAVEVKVRGSLADLLRQIARYAQHDAVEEILVVTTRCQLTTLPAKLNGKPIRSLVLLGSML